MQAMGAHAAEAEGAVGAGRHNQREARLQHAGAGVRGLQAAQHQLAAAQQDARGALRCQVGVVCSCACASGRARDESMEGAPRRARDEGFDGASCRAWDEGLEDAPCRAWEEGLKGASDCTAWPPQDHTAQSSGCLFKWGIWCPADCCSSRRLCAGAGPRRAAGKQSRSATTPLASTTPPGRIGALTSQVSNKWLGVDGGASGGPDRAGRIVSSTAPAM